MAAGVETVKNHRRDIFVPWGTIVEVIIYDSGQMGKAG